MGNEALLPLVNPTLVSISLGFAGGVLGMIWGRNRVLEARFDKVAFRAQTGVSIEEL